MAQRQTWLSSCRFSHLFLLDNETPKLAAEQELHGDLLFLNATFSGVANGYGEKLLTWFRYAHEHFPKTPLYGKVDDDVFICEDEFYDFLRKENHPRSEF